MMHVTLIQVSNNFKNEQTVSVWMYADNSVLMLVGIVSYKWKYLCLQNIVSCRGENK